MGSYTYCFLAKTRVQKTNTVEKSIHGHVCKSTNRSSETKEKLDINYREVILSKFRTHFACILFVAGR